MPHKELAHDTIQRVRAKLARTGKASVDSHLKQIDRIRKSLEKSSWPLTYSRSKRLKIRIRFGPAISVGYESKCELMDVDLSSRMNFKTAIDDLQKTLEEGYEVLNVKSIPRLFPSLEECTNLVFYEVRSDLLKGTKKKWEEFWSKKTFPVLKKKTDQEIFVDARPLVRAWNLDGNCLKLELRFGPNRTLKPERIIQAVCQLSDPQIDMTQEKPQLKICRTKLCFEKQNGDLIDI